MSLIFLLGEDAISWLLNDQFSTNASAPLGSPAAAEPGPGTRTIVDTGNLFSIASNKLTTSAAGGSTWIDPRIVYSALTRAEGIALFCTINVTGSTFANIGLYRNNSGALVNGAASITFGATLLLLDRSNGNVTIGSKTASIDYALCIILRSLGAYYFIKGGSEYPAWTLLFVDPIDSTATVYPTAIVQGTAGAKTIDDARMRQLPAPFTAAYGLAAFNVTSDGQTLGAELVSNGNMETGSPPTGWSAGGATLTSAADERTGGGGTKSINIALTAGAVGYAYQSAGSLNDIVEISGWLRNIDLATGVFIYGNAGNTGIGSSASTSWSKIDGIIKASISTTIWIYANGNTIGQSGRFDDISLKKITLPAAQTTSADALFYLDFTLPASPVAGQRITLLYRISASGEELNNCWCAYIQRNNANTNWDFKLDSISAGTTTNRVNVASIGSTDTLCIIASGNNHDCYTKSGSTWTKRGSTVTNATFATATLSNYIYAQGFTFGAFRAFNRTDPRWSAELDRTS